MKYPPIFKLISKQIPVLKSIVIERDRLREELATVTKEKDRLQSQLQLGTAPHVEQPEAMSANNTSFELIPYLPVLSGIPTTIQDGRNVSEGYSRGWGIQFADLREKILSDPLYQAAVNVSLDRSIQSEENRMNIFLILRFFLGRIPFGHIVEYGSFRGGSAIFMAFVVKHLYPGMKVYALDTFEGMPVTDKNLDAHSEGDFSNTDFDSLQERVNQLGLDNLVLVKGLFENTNEEVMKSAQNICLAHIDCDIASAVKFAYDGVKQFMNEGGYIVFDDATVSSCIGATDVVEKYAIRRDGLSSEQIWPHFVFRSFDVHKDKILAA